MERYFFKGLLFSFYDHMCVDSKITLWGFLFLRMHLYYGICLRGFSFIFHLVLFRVFSGRIRESLLCQKV